MKYLVTLATLAAASAASAQVVISTANSTYTNDFDALGSSANPSYMLGWSGWKIAGSGALAIGAEVNSSTSPQFTTGTGSDSTGTVYNFGPSGNNDRALGLVASGTFAGAIGAAFLNNTTETLEARIAVTIEQWRSGSNSSNTDILAFSWKVGGSLTDGAGWTAVTALDAVEIQTGTASAAALNGNDDANRLPIALTSLGALNWIPGSTLFIRWADADTTGADAGLGIDNFSLETLAVPEPSTWAAIIGATAVAVALLRRRRS